VPFVKSEPLLEIVCPDSYQLPTMHIACSTFLFSLWSWTWWYSDVDRKKGTCCMHPLCL